MQKVIKLAVLSCAVGMVLASSAMGFTDKGAPLNKDVTLPGKGTSSFSGGTSCKETTGTVVLKVSGSAEITNFPTDNPETQCEVIGTLKSLGCTAMASQTSTGLPWPVDNNGTTLTATGIHIDIVYTGGAFCPKAFTLSGNVTATPDNVSEISSLTLSGTLKSSVAGIMGVISGTLVPVNESDKGTYGLK